MEKIPDRSFSTSAEKDKLKSIHCGGTVTLVGIFILIADQKVMQPEQTTLVGIFILKLIMTTLDATRADLALLVLYLNKAEARDKICRAIQLQPSQLLKGPFICSI